MGTLYQYNGKKWIELGKAGKDGKTPTKKELRELIKPLIPIPVAGQDGSPDTGEEIVDKINDLPIDTNTHKIDSSHIKGLREAISASGTSFGGLANYVPYTGATTNVDLGANTLTAGQIIDSGLTTGRLPYATTNGRLTDTASITCDGTFLKLLSDSVKLYFGADSDMTMWYDGTNGNIKTSDVAASDLHIQCGTDKTLVLDETVWDDLRVTPGSFDRVGVSDPTIVAYDVNGGGTNTYLWQFDKNNIASFTVQLPHSYKTGTDIYCHIHWTPGANGVTESGNTVGWKVQYSWANINSNFGTMATLDLSDACDGTNHKHQMTPDVVIDGHTVAKGISSMLICNILRTDTGSDDTWSGTASGARPMLLEIDFHYEIDTVGSRQISAK